MKSIYDIEGMTCSACSAAVEKAVSKLDGVNKVNVNLLTKSMVVDHDESILDRNISRAVADAGYKAISQSNKGDSENDGGNEISNDLKNLRNRTIISFVFMVPLMYLAMGEMLGLPMANIFKGPENSLIFAFSQMLLTLPVIYVNRSYYKNGFRTLIKGSPNMDSLIALGSSAAFIYGVFVIYMLAYGLGHGEQGIIHKYMHSLYFESAAMILALISLGKYLESRAKYRSTDAIKNLMDLSPKTAIKLVNGKPIEVGIKEVQVGDSLLVKPGGAIPVDGVIIKGRAAVDESAITGESIPVDLELGDRVIGSTIVQAGSIQIRAEKVGEDTSLAKIIQLVKDANSSKAPIAKLADKISGIFVPAVILIALATCIIWLLLGESFEFALTMGISVLVISCPCALGLATPVSIMVGTGQGAKNGILIKSAEALETLHELDLILLDKTGTITQGRPVVTDIISKTLDEEEFLSLAASMESPSEHPLSKSITNYAKEKGIKISDPDDFNNIVGSGIEASIKGTKYYAGNLAYMEEIGLELGDYKDLVDNLAKKARTPMYFADEEKLIGIIAVADLVKETSVRAIKDFHDRGLDVYMVTGDNELTAKAIAKEVGIDRVYSDVLPSQKEAIVREIKDSGVKLAMVGDGINDAPALARADVGIAIGAGTDVAIDAADLVLIRNSLVDVANARDLSVATIKNIRQNLFWAFFYNIVLIPVAAGLLYKPFGIVLNPMIASAAMSLSSVFVVTNALRLNRFKAKHDTRENNNLINNDRIEREQAKEIGMEERIIKIEGMSCGHCSSRVEEALNSIEGLEAKVDLEKNEARVKLTSDISNDELIKSVTDAGYKVISVE